jgi:hypothetical protein
LPQTEAEQAEMERSLQALAIGLKRDGETDDDAYKRIKDLKYVTVFRHDEYWPFYHCAFKLGKVILTINTAHPFFKKVWEPLSELAKTPELSADVDEDGTESGDPSVKTTCTEVLVGLQLMLHSLARTQSQIAAPDDIETIQLLDNFRREWSSNLATQLIAR